MITMQRGTLITLEGGEGAGKSTLSYRIRSRLNGHSDNVVVLREPGGTFISEQIRDIVLNHKYAGISYTTEVLLFQAARAQIYSEVVIPSLEMGKTVIMDRSRDSSVVYQGMVRGFGRELINQLNDISTRHTVPDLTILLDVPVEIGLGRREEAGEDNRLDLESKQFHQNVRDAYLQLAQEDTSGRWHVVDASAPLEQVEEAVWQLVVPHLKTSTDT